MTQTPTLTQQQEESQRALMRLVHRLGLIARHKNPDDLAAFIWEECARLDGLLVQFGIDPDA